MVVCGWPHQTEKTDVAVVLVGGGSCLVDRSVGLHGATSLITPDNHWVSWARSSLALLDPITL